MCAVGSSRTRSWHGRGFWLRCPSGSGPNGRHHAPRPNQQVGTAKPVRCAERQGQEAMPRSTWCARAGVRTWSHHLHRVVRIATFSLVGGCFLASIRPRSQLAMFEPPERPTHWSRPDPGAHLVRPPEPKRGAADVESQAGTGLSSASRSSATATIRMIDPTITPGSVPRTRRRVNRPPVCPCRQ